MAYPAAAVAALVLLGAGVGGALFADGRMAYDAWPRPPEPDVPKRVAPGARALTPTVTLESPPPAGPRGPRSPRPPRAAGGPPARTLPPPGTGPRRPPARRERRRTRPGPAPAPAPAPPVQTSPPATGAVAPAPDKPRKKENKGQREAGGKPKHKANGA